MMKKFAHFLSLLTLPLSLAASASELPPDAAALAARGPDALAAAYASAPEPCEIPSGRAVGTHVIPPGTPAQLPGMLTWSTFHLWSAKDFDASSKTMQDVLIGLEIGPKAALSIGRIDDSLTRAFGTDAQADIGDGRTALITDYSVEPQLVGDTAGWIDEFREVSPKLWLGRSFYKGQFWGYVILKFE